MKKGISPLIAAIVLLAFTIVIASIGSKFFIGFSKERKIETEQKGEKTMDCSEVLIEIDSDSITDNTPNNVSLILENNGEVSLGSLIITTFNNTAVVNGNATPSSISSASVERIRTNKTVGGGLNKISVSSRDCPGMKSIVEKSDGTWQAVA